MKGRLAKLRRVQDLFTEGQIVVLEKNGVSEPFWVAKPSSFERDEAVKDARAARSRRGLRFDNDPDEQAVVEAQLAQVSRADILDSLIGAKGNEHYVRALDEIRTNKDWAERIDVIDRAGLEHDRDATDEDRETVRQVTTDYMVEVQRLQETYVGELRAELEQLPEEELQKKYRDTWRDMASFEAFLESRRVTEMYFALRLCEATRVDDTWVHDGCDHRVRLLDERNEVYDLPDALIDAVRQALEQLQMTPRDAGNSAAPATSSASSEQPAEEADSQVSGQAVT
jgi:hypothetical protein